MNCKVYNGKTNTKEKRGDIYEQKNKTIKWRK